MTPGEAQTSGTKLARGEVARGPAGAHWGPVGSRNCSRFERPRLVRATMIYTHRYIAPDEKFTT